MRLHLIAAFAFCLIAPEARAHYHMLIPDRNSIKTGEETTLTYQFGHPFEHQLFDTAAPDTATIYLPDGKALDVKEKLKKVEVAGQGKKKVTAYQLTFKPEQRGDHTVVFTSPAVTIEGEKLPVFDTVKVVIHVQTQNGWESPSARGKDQHVDLRPLTRPYGLRSGMLFRAQFSDPTIDPIGSGTIFSAYQRVEIERYNPEPPKVLPPEEHITYLVITDRDGVLASTLPDPGWWAVTAIRPPVNSSEKSVYRCTFWVLVDDKIPLKPAE